MRSLNTPNRKWLKRRRLGPECSIWGGDRRPRRGGMAIVGDATALAMEESHRTGIEEEAPIYSSVSSACREASSASKTGLLRTYLRDVEPSRHGSSEE